jgi:hypothetical protein
MNQRIVLGCHKSKLTPELYLSRRTEKESAAYPAATLFGVKSPQNSAATEISKIM